MTVAESFFAFILAFVIIFTKNVSSEICLTPGNGHGNCVHLTDCQALYNLEKTANNRDFLSRSVCRYEDSETYVCCPSISAPRFGEIIELPQSHDGMCGRSFINISSRIVGGEYAKLGEFPWAALLAYKKPFNMIGYHCGGSIITSQHVLSAAHCVQSYPATWTLIKVRIGEFDLELNSDCEQYKEIYYCAPPAIDVDIAKISTHYQYNSNQQGHSHDIAVIKLASTIEFSRFVKPICLPHINMDSGPFTVAGFGRTEVSASSTILMKADIDAVDNYKCSSKYLLMNRRIHHNQICALGTHSDACSGDSGGGLFKHIEETNIWYLAGVVSYGSRNCSSNFPGIYVNVYKFVDWIKTKIKESN